MDIKEKTVKFGIKTIKKISKMLAFCIKVWYYECTLKKYITMMKIINTKRP